MHSLCIPVLCCSLPLKYAAVRVQDKCGGKYFRKDLSVNWAFGYVHRDRIIIFLKEFPHIFFLIHHGDQHEIHVIFFGVVKFLYGGPFLAARFTPGAPKIKENQLFPFEILQVGAGCVYSLQFYVIVSIIYSYCLLNGCDRNKLFLDVIAYVGYSNSNSCNSKEYNKN